MEKTIRYTWKTILAFSIAQVILTVLTFMIMKIFDLVEVLEILTIFAFVTILHELLHYATARLLGKDCTIVVKYFGFGIVLENPVTFRELVTICLCPQAITLTLLLAYAITNIKILLATALVHAAASIGDFYNILRIGIEKVRMGKILIIDREDGFKIVKVV